MSLSNPVNPPIVNEAVAKASSSGFMVGIDENQTKVNQLHGIASNNSIGAGIPKQVSNAQVSIANASQGSTCTVSVLFKADPTDSLLSGVNIWVKGYQGNNNPVKVGSGTSSPTKIVLNNTGETVTFIIQAFGNGGNAPFSNSPTCSGTLPKSTSGGFGSSTVTSSPATTFTGDVTSVGSVATVVGIRGRTVSTQVPVFGDTLVFDGTTWVPGLAMPTRTYRFDGNGTTQGAISSTGTGTALGFSGTTARINATGTDVPLLTTITTSASVNNNGFTEGGGMSLTNMGLFKRFRIRIRPTSYTANNRYWIGLMGAAGGGQVVGSATFVTDTPNTQYVAFRASGGSENWQACCGTATASQTKVNTGIAVDLTSSHVFEITWDGASVRFYIDLVLVATITTNVPTAASTLGLSAMLAGAVYDNSNTITTVGYAFSNMRITDLV